MRYNYFRFYIFSTIFIAVLPGTGNEEFRSTWVITWNHIDRSKNPGQNMNTVQTIMDNHVAANMNAVIFQVRQSGTAYYESSQEPWGYYSGYQYPGYDPLEFAIEEAHKRGLELHAWFNVFQTSSTTTGAPAAEHPEWICRDQSGNVMTSYRSVSPGIKDVRDYTVDVAMEIVNNYDIDGLHLDYVRWNEHTNTTQRNVSLEMELQRQDGFITPAELQQLNTNLSGRYLYDYLHPYSAGVPEGYGSWEEWWRWSVTEFVHTLHDSIQAVKPHVKLSAAVLGKYNWSGWQGYGTVYQDAALWYNEGYLDHIMPMHYHWTSASGFLGMLEQDCPQCWKIFIQTGIASNRPFTAGPGSYVLEEYGVWNNHSDIVNACRGLGWVDGFQFFSYGTWRDQNYFTTAGNSFFYQKAKLPYWSDSQVVPSAPLLVMAAVDSFHNKLTIYPVDLNEPAWLILYRSLDPETTPATAKILDIQFSDRAVSYTDQLSTIDTSKVFIYFATIADRSWNESGPSDYIFSNSGPVPEQYILSQNFPNPFNGYTKIKYGIPKFGQIELNIYSLQGTKIQTLVNQTLIPGEYEIQWNGRNTMGQRQSSGVYIYSIFSGGKKHTSRKLVLLK